MPVIEYKLHKIGKNAKAIPDWVEDGGHWRNPSDSTMLGWVEAEADRDYYIPDTVTELDKSAVTTRILGIHSANPFPVMGEDGTPTEDNMTTEQVTNMAEDWYDSFISGR